MEPPPAEITVICIDNSLRMKKHPIFEAQLKAIEFYCETKFKCNPENLVGLFTMSSFQRGTLLSPTRNLQQILRSLRDIRYAGEVDFSFALERAWASIFRSPPNMKKRLLMFVGSPISLEYRRARVYGTMFKEEGAAVDVVNFFVLKRDISSLIGYSILHGKYHYAKMELDALFTAAKHNDDSHLEDVEDASSVCDILSNSILKKDLLYLGKKHQEKAEENVNVKQELELSRNKENKAAADNEYVEAPGIQFVKPKLERFHNEKNKSAADDEHVQAPGIKQYPTKKTPHISGKKNQKKPEENLNYKQELELSRNENKQKLELSRNEENKAAADEKCVEAPGIQFVKPMLERFHNEKNKSAADDYVQAPGIKQYPTTHLSGKKSQKKPEENVNFKQESELSCNEKNKTAADDEHVEAPGIQFDKPKLERFPNEKADDEYVQAPGIKQYPTKNCPGLSRKKKKKKPKQNVNV